jgi:hypothetical protein
MCYVGRFAWGFSGLLPFAFFALRLGLPQMRRFYCLLHSVASHGVFKDFRHLTFDFRLYNVVASLRDFQDFCLLPFAFRLYDVVAFLIMN